MDNTKTSFGSTAQYKICRKTAGLIRLFRSSAENDNNASNNNLEEKVQDLTEPESKAADKTAILSQTKENPSPESGQTQKSAHKCHS